MNFSKLYTSMQKWTPLSVSCTIIVIMAVCVIGVLTFRNQPVPQWAIEVLTIFGTLLGATGLISHGATVATGAATNAASETAKAVVSQALPELNIGQNGETK